MRKPRKIQIRRANAMDKDHDTRDFSQFTENNPAVENLTDIRQQWLDSSKEEDDQ